MFAAHKGAFAWCVMVLCCWWSAGNSAPLACEELVRPLDQADPHPFAGRWALISGGLRDAIQWEFINSKESASIDVIVSPTGNISYTTQVNMNGTCYSDSYNVMQDGSTVTFDDPELVNVTVTILHTSCADCLLIHFAKDGRAFLFSRRRVLTEKEKEEFKAQVGCLNMLEPAWMDPSKELCPEGTGTNQDT